MGIIASVAFISFFLLFYASQFICRHSVKEFFCTAACMAADHVAGPHEQ